MCCFKLGVAASQWQQMQGATFAVCALGTLPRRHAVHALPCYLQQKRKPLEKQESKRAKKRRCICAVLMQHIMQQNEISLKQIEVCLCQTLGPIAPCVHFVSIACVFANNHKPIIVRKGDMPINRQPEPTQQNPQADQTRLFRVPRMAGMGHKSKSGSSNDMAQTRIPACALAGAQAMSPVQL